MGITTTLSAATTVRVASAERSGNAVAQNARTNSNARQAGVRAGQAAARAALPTRDHHAKTLRAPATTGAPDLARRASRAQSDARRERACRIRRSSLFVLIVDGLCAATCQRVRRARQPENGGVS
jgi:hypothetical protein